jgi:membrane fusion protein (multidrug efflux system)
MRPKPSILRLVPLLPLALAAAVAACGKESKAERPEGALVDTTTVATEDVRRVLRAVGTVEAENQTVVKAEVDGQVSRIVADEGAALQQGDIVLQLEPTPARLVFYEAAATLTRVEATLQNDEKLLQRYAKLLEAGAIDQQSYDDVDARVKSGRAQLQEVRARTNQARWNLGKTTIRAPFSGRVGDRLVELGTYVSEGDDLFELVDPAPVRVAFELPESDVGALELGDEVSFTLRTGPRRQYTGKVIYLSPDLNRETRTQTAKAEYANDKGEVTPGAFADLEVTTAVREDAPVIPEEALVSEGEQNFVYIVDGGKAQKREVALGERLEGRLEVMKGLEGGEILVVRGHRELSDGMPVRYAERPAARPGEIGPGQ